MKKYILSLDSGTTSVRALLFDRNGNVRSMAQHDFTQIFPHAGWVEHDPNEIWSLQLAAAREAIKNAGADAGDIAAIGITNQRETTVVWDRNTGECVYNAIVWQCRRTGGYCDSIDVETQRIIRDKTGLVVDPYFSATKIKWILENVPGAAEKAAAGRLCFGTVDSWLIWNLSGRRVHATDSSNAARTMLFNINTMSWDSELCDYFGIPESMLPTVCPSSGVICESDPELLGAPVPVSGAAGDQQAALFGQRCFERGDVKNTYGTGCFLLMNTGDSPAASDNGLLTTVGWEIDGKVSYALEGSVFSAGCAVQWLRDSLGLIGESAESEYMARQAADTGGCYFVPAFTGLGAPYWAHEARGLLCGISRGTDRNMIVRAVLESIAYQTMDVIDAMMADSGIRMNCLRVDGGASANDFLMQFQADMSSCTVVRPASVETTALGAAFLAGLAVDMWRSVSEFPCSAAESRFSPRINGSQRSALVSGWKKAVARALL